MKGYLDVPAVARRAGVTPKTIHTYHTLGEMPRAKPEDYVSDSPTWPESVIEEWLANRRGSGWRKGIPRDQVKPVPVTVTPADRRMLRQWSRFGGKQAALARRARIVLLAADGLSDREIADQLGVTKATATTWRRRFNEGGLAELQSRVTFQD